MCTDDQRTPPQHFFEASPQGLAVHNRVRDTIQTIGAATVRVTKSQISFRRRPTFAFLWRPGQYVKSDVPAVLSISLAREVSSGRFKSVVHPSTRVWMHHLEITEADQVDEEVCGWLAEAYDRSG